MNRRNPPYNGLIKPRVRIALFALLATLSAFVAHFVFWDRALEHDWVYFDNLSGIVRSNVLSHGVFPLHNPWQCGGLDLLANPQTRIFSPLFLLDLLFIPPHANALSLMVWGFFGFLGMFAFAKTLLRDRAPDWVCLVLSFLWIHAGWFGLHYAEGHIAYGAFQVLPLGLALFLSLEQRRCRYGFCVLTALMILDGGVYSAIYLGFGCVSLIASGLKPLRDFRAVLRDRWHSLFAVALFLLLVSLKVIPLTTLYGQREPERHFETHGLNILLRAFFHPNPSAGWKPSAEARFGFHEYGCYLGAIAIGLCGWYLIRFRKLSSRLGLRLFIVALFWFWGAYGWLDPVTPWRVIKSVPVIQSINAQPRLSILSVLFLLPLVGLALATLAQTRNKLAIALSTLLCLEWLVARQMPVWAKYRASRRPASDYAGLVYGRTFERTLRQGWYYSMLKPGITFKHCYDPFQVRSEVTSLDQPDYRGVIQVVGPGMARILEFVPSHIKLAVDVTVPRVIVVNTNHLAGWCSDDVDIISKRPGERLTVRTRGPFHGTVALRYCPRYLPFQ